MSLLDEILDLELIFLSDFAKGEYEGKSRSDVYQSKNGSQAIALDALYAKEILKDADPGEIT